ncbi:MAG: hypothetical protein C4309_06235, partial [Chloroflexota bacterium]
MGGRAFVTGASGFLGAHLVRRLIAAGAEVAILVRDPQRMLRLQTLHMPLSNVWVGDVLDREQVQAALA